MNSLAIILLILTCAIAAPAQPPCFELESDLMTPEEAPELMEQQVEPPPPAPPPDSPVFLWMQRLRERNPALCARLEQVYRDNPRAFHLRVRRLMEQERIRLVLQRYPKVMEAVAALSQEERAELYRDLALPELPPPRGREPYRGHMREGPPGHGPTAMRDRPPFRLARERLESLGKLAELRQRYRNAADDSERKAVLAEARSILEEIQRQRHSRQLQRIQRIEAELTRIKEELEKSQSSQDEILERQLSLWLDSTNTPTASSTVSPAQGKQPD